MHLILNEVPEAATLKILDPEVPSEIYVDASNSGFAACFIQNKRSVALLKGIINRC